MIFVGISFSQDGFTTTTIAGNHVMPIAETDAIVTPMCVNCQTYRQGCDKQYRGLCNRCYNDVEISSAYPMLHRNLGKFEHFEMLPLPLEHTNAKPGTIEKIFVMQQRLSDKFHLHHPRDLVQLEQSVSGNWIYEERAAILPDQDQDEDDDEY